MGNSLENIYTSDQIIAELEQLTGRNDEFFYLTHISNAMREIGVVPSYSKTDCVPVEELKIKKPCDWAVGIDMNLLGANGEQIYNYTFHQGSNMQSNEVDRDRGMNNYAGNIRDYGITASEIGDDYIRLSSQAKGVAKAELNYYAYPIDEHGDIMVPAVFREPVTSYVLWKMKLKDHFRTPKAVTKNEVDSFERTYIMHAKEALGEARLPSALQADAMLNQWVTRIPDFRKKPRKRNYGY